MCSEYHIREKRAGPALAIALTAGATLVGTTVSVVSFALGMMFIVTPSLCISRYNNQIITYFLNPFQLDNMV